MSQNSRVVRSWPITRSRGVSSSLAAAAEALGGVGGLDGMKNEGIDATVAWLVRGDLKRRWGSYNDGYI